MKRVTMTVVALLLMFTLAVRPAAAQEQDIVEIASGNADFSTLVTAIQEAGLVETLQGDGPFTVFAPTNAAFEKLPAGTLEAVLADKELLTSILTYHVVSGKVMAADVLGMDGQEAATVQGESIMISVEGSTVMVNNATVTMTDIEASNGVIHVIDTVLIPPTVAAAMAAQSGASGGSTQPAPQTMPTTGGEPATPVMPMVAVAAGLLLLGGAYALRPRTR